MIKQDHAEPFGCRGWGHQKKGLVRSFFFIEAAILSLVIAFVGDFIVAASVCNTGFVPFSEARLGDKSERFSIEHYKFLINDDLFHGHPVIDVKTARKTDRRFD